MLLHSCLLGYAIKLLRGLARGVALEECYAFECVAGLSHVSNLVAIHLCVEGLGSMHTVWQEPASLVMTASAVEKLLSCSTSWLEVADQLVQVCGESQVGKVMFGWVWQGVRSERISHVIIEALKVFRKKQVTELLFNDYRARCWDGIKAMDKDLKTFHNMRTISVEYRGVPVKPLTTKSEVLFFPTAHVAYKVSR